MVALWVELKKLAGAGLRLAGATFLMVAVLNGGLGMSMILAAPGGYTANNGSPAPDGTRLVHLQLFGGLLHAHAGKGDDHNHGPKNIRHVPNIAKIPDTNQSLDTALTQITSANNNAAALDNSDGSSESLLVLTPKYQGSDSLAALVPSGLIARQLPFHPLPLPDPYLSAPDKPPTKNISFFTELAKPVR